MDRKNSGGLKAFKFVLLGSFFQTFVFWYAFEKLFLISINLNNFQIGAIIAITSISVLLFEFPSGVLADRWSRKGTLILASFALLAADLLGYFTNDFFTYGLAAAAWGLFYAMQSGVYGSITYDMLLDNKLEESNYDKYYGRVRIVEGIALIMSSLSGAFLAEAYGLRTVYLFSIPLNLLSIFFLYKIVETRSYKTKIDQLSTWQYVGDVFKYLKTSIFLKLCLLELIIIATIFTIVFEFSQLYFVAIALPVTFFGIGNAMLSAPFSFGGLVANSLRSRSSRPIKFLLIVAPFIAFLHYIVRSSWGVLLPTVLMTIFMTLEIRFGRILHGQLPSKYRASVSSLTSTIGRLIAIPLAFLFGWLIDYKSYFVASFIITVTVLAALLIGFMVLKNKNSL